MIDTTKLIPRRSKTSALSPNSLINLNVIKVTTKKIDDILKERLVLSKIRYGIERQQLERSLRRGTETRLEDSDDNEKDYDITNDPNPKKPKPGLGGILGGLFKGIISSIGGVVFTVLPLLLRFSKLFRKIANPFTLITGTILGGIGIITRLTDREGKKIKKKDVDQVKGNNLSNVFGNFNNAIQELVFGIIAGAVATRTISNLRTANLRAQLKGKISDDQARILLQRDALANRYQKGLRIGLERGRSEGFARGYKKGSSEMFEAFDKMMMEGDRTPRTITKKIVKKEALVGDRLGVSARDKEFFQRLKLDPSLGRRGVDPKEILSKNTLSNRKKMLNDIYFGRDPGREAIDEFFDPDVEDLIKEADEFIGVDEKTGKLIKEKKVTPRRARRRKPSKTVEQLKAEIDARNPTFTGKSGGKLPMKGKMKADFLAKKAAGKKGLGKLLTNIGGTQFIKPIRKFISEGVATIPIIGDLIGILLDVFVFGEPVGRAAFMASGSILGGFLGGLAGTIGGPPGVLIGSIIGGIGGDLLGAAFYDLLFRRGEGSNLGGRLPISTVKGATKGLFTGGFAGYGTYMLGEGGREFVLDADSTAALERKSPGFLMALNKARGAEAIGVIEDYASYDKTSTGREKMIPVPIPIPQKDSSTQQIIMTDSEVGGGTGGGFLTFLSEHYRRA